MANRRRDAERRAAERRGHFGDELFLSVFLRAEPAGEIASQPVLRPGPMRLMPISA
jgi:hypothetical protein